MKEKPLDTQEVALMLELMQPGDTLRRERDHEGKLTWHFQRYHGKNWIDVTHRFVKRALSAIAKEKQV